MQTSTTLQGTVERITFHNVENGFCVLRVKISGHQLPVTVTGNLSHISAGESIRCEGSWYNDARFGMQFRATQLIGTPPATLTGMEKYLGSGMINGVGPGFAKKLIATFGKDVFDVIENQPEKLQKMAGLGKKRAAAITTAWQEQQNVRDIMVFLQSHGVSAARAMRIFRSYGKNALRLVQQNPYRLAKDIHGIGFKTADELAQDMGIPSDSLLRARAGLQHTLKLHASRGHCAMPHEALRDAASTLLEVHTDIIDEAIRAEIAAADIIAETIDDEPCLFPSYLHRAETAVAKHIRRLQNTEKHGKHIDIATAIPWVEKKTGLQLSQSQRNALTCVLDSRVAVITGGPGVGKTTVVNSLLKILQLSRRAVALCAPTGRAARRLMETTGMKAATIHRLLEFDPREMAFKHSESNPLPIDVLIVDEASMVDIILFHQLLRALPAHCMLILVGDVDQLPSVGAGAVLQDVIRSNALPVARLTEIFRQAAGSDIIQNAHRINKGDMPVSGQHSAEKPADFFVSYAETPEEIRDKVLQLVTTRLPASLQCDPIRHIQVLTPMNRGGLGTIALNSALQQMLNGHAEPKITRFGWTLAPQDKVIQTVNNYQKEVFNGDIGFVHSINLEKHSLSIDFDGRLINYDFNELDEISLAYAISIHKSQGSEFPIVVMPLSTQHYTLLARNLLYTGVTRGRQLVIVVGQKKAIRLAVNNNRENQRLTRLAARLAEQAPATSAAL